MDSKQLCPSAVVGRRGTKSKKSWCNLFVSGSVRRVNSLHRFAVILFRNALVDGIALPGWPNCPWLSRLVELLTVLAEAMAEKSGVRA